jgi:hypothetical protein
LTCGISLNLVISFTDVNSKLVGRFTNSSLKLVGSFTRIKIEIPENFHTYQHLTSPVAAKPHVVPKTIRDVVQTTSNFLTPTRALIQLTFQLFSYRHSK